MSTGAGIDIQQRLEVLIQDFRTSDPPMPVVVLHAEDGADDAEVGRLVEELHAGQEAHGTRCALVEEEPDGETEVRRAVALVRDLGDPKRWEGRRSIYRRYAFPRLRLVRAIEDAVRELQGAGAPGRSRGAPDPAQRLLDQLARQRWRPKDYARRNFGLPLFDMAHILPATLVAGLAALFARGHWLVAVASGIGFLALLVVLENFAPGRAPIFLWLRRESRWFMTTTFLRAASRRRPTDVSLLRPIRSWKAIAARAHDVAEAMKEGDDFQLQLYVLALFEDLRDNHRRWSWDLRGFKRPRPPMLFLPQVSMANGGIELIKAVSDVRSRRSELDPLLIVAAVRSADVNRLQRTVVQRPSGALWVWYQEWARNLRAGQSPSRQLAELPWVLKVPLVGERLRPLVDGQHHCVKASTRPTPARLVWSLHTLVLVAALLATAVVTRSVALHQQHCSVSLLTANQYTVLRPAPDGEADCIGIATGDVSFTDWLTEAAQGSGADRVPWTLADLERRIDAENAEVRAKHPHNHVTVVYAGPLSADRNRHSSPVKGLEELAGVHLAQAVINDTFTVKLQVRIANGGADLQHQKEMAEAIADYAEHDPTVVGVVGTGRDLKSSRATTRILRDAGLPVVSGTNSAAYLPREFANWFSLAAPDDWQVAQLGLIAGQLRTSKKRQYAVVLARDTRGTDDLYTEEQAKYAQRMLDEKGFTLLPQRRYRAGRGSAELRVPVERICRGEGVPSVIYFAGRVEDIDPLMTQLASDPTCGRRSISVLTGDDLSKANFSRGQEGVAPKVTLYHAALAELKQAAAMTMFYSDAGKYLPGVGEQRLSPRTPAFASGQTALAHDATRALYWAASRDNEPQNRAATWANLRTVELRGMATGIIDFTGAPLYDDRSGHSIALKKVRRTADGAPESVVVCSRMAGEVKPLTEADCSISRPREADGG